MYVSVDRNKPRHGLGWQVVRVVFATLVALFGALALLGEDYPTAGFSLFVAGCAAYSFVRSKRMRADGDTDRP